MYVCLQAGAAILRCVGSHRPTGPAPGNPKMQSPNRQPKHRTRLFQNGNSQAVRIPKELAYPRPDMEMEIERRGDTLVIRPSRQRLVGLARVFQAFGCDFMQEGREQPDVPDRERATVRDR